MVMYFVLSITITSFRFYNIKQLSWTLIDKYFTVNSVNWLNRTRKHLKVYNLDKYFTVKSVNWLNRTPKHLKVFNLDVLTDKNGSFRAYSIKQLTSNVYFYRVFCSKKRLHWTFKSVYFGRFYWQKNGHLAVFTDKRGSFSAYAIK